MDKLIISGNKKIFGKVIISGSKNAVLPIMAATIIEPGIYQISNVPDLKDTRTMIDLLKIIGARIKFTKNKLIINSKHCNNPNAPYDLVKTMRASFYVLGPLLSRFKKASVSLPGGCAWGPRPVDFHIKALREMGAKIDLEDGNIIMKGELHGREIKFKKISVGATGNIIMAAVKAKGTTTLINASMEPEIINLVNFLQKLGSKISVLTKKNMYIIHGVEKLNKSAACKIIPDRIEAGTYMIATALIGGEVIISNIILEHLDILIKKLKKSGVNIETGDEYVKIVSSKTIKPVDIETSEFPGFPTDLQAQWMALMTQSQGNSKITENIYKDRFTHVSELKRFGAEIKLKNNTAYIKGVKELKAAPVMSTDIRASASLVLAALKAKGKSEISRIYHLDRGYENLVNKFFRLGAQIQRVN